MRISNSSNDNSNNSNNHYRGLYFDLGGVRFVTHLRAATSPNRSVFVVYVII